MKSPQNPQKKLSKDAPKKTQISTTPHKKGSNRTAHQSEFKTLSEIKDEIEQLQESIRQRRRTIRKFEGEISRLGKKRRRPQYPQHQKDKMLQTINRLKSKIEKKQTKVAKQKKTLERLRKLKKKIARS